VARSRQAYGRITRRVRARVSFEIPRLRLSLASPDISLDVLLLILYARRRHTAQRILYGRRTNGLRSRVDESTDYSYTDVCIGTRNVSVTGSFVCSVVIGGKKSVVTATRGGPLTTGRRRARGGGGGAPACRRETVKTTAGDQNRDGKTRGQARGRPSWNGAGPVITAAGRDAGAVGPAARKRIRVFRFPRAGDRVRAAVCYSLWLWGCSSPLSRSDIVRQTHNRTQTAARALAAPLPAPDTTHGRPPNDFCSPAPLALVRSRRDSCCRLPARRVYSCRERPRQHGRFPCTDRPSPNSCRRSRTRVREPVRARALSTHGPPRSFRTYSFRRVFMCRNGFSRPLTRMSNFR